MVDCETQAEVDELWAKLTAGGKESRCGWLEDRYGVSWQIVPSVLLRLLRDPNPTKANAAMQAMLQMGKLEVARLQQAFDAA
jgi:predicted 3-demethylubiquinone-9 3-methyltransferase (glyoxalase superfamily)